MRAAAIIVVIFGALGFVGGYLFASFTTKVVPTIKEQREAVPTREVPADWRFDKYSPGHSQHVVNQAQKCNNCHDPSKAGFEDVDIGVCTGCHIEQASHPHLGENGEITECTTCHTYKFFAEAESPWDCVRCHGPFDTPTHAGLAMHEDIACATCHHPHKPTEETAADCNDCHERLNVQHGRPKLSGTCADCHGGHKLAAEAPACMECHQDPPSRVARTAVFRGGHDACVDCHQPHSFSAATALRCGNCHERTRVFAQNTAREHRDCSSCHAPHAVRRAGDATCKGCHEDIASTHVAKGESECISCHDPHPRRVSQIAMRCSSCHDEAQSERAFHAQKTVCTDCHEPHGFDLSGIAERVLCADCHRQQVQLTARVADHQSCASCHEGTAHELQAPVACASCHEDILSKSPEGHQECASCHEPHGGAVAAATACSSCHESTGLPGLHRLPSSLDESGHSECSACHNIHDASVRADRASCMECHTDIADHQPDANVCTGCHTFISGAPRATMKPRRRGR